MKKLKQRNKSLYQELILKMALFLILPFMIVTFILYGEIISDGEKSYLSNITLLTEQAESVRSDHLENMSRISDRISSNQIIKGFFLTKYTSDTLRRYAAEITQMVSGGLAYENIYIPKLYLTNTTIPRGFQMFYHMSDIEYLDCVKEFLSSDETEKWITPTQVSDYVTTPFTPFKGHYTYMKKVLVDEQLVFLLTLSVSDLEMDEFLHKEYDGVQNVNNQILEADDTLLVNCSSRYLNPIKSESELTSQIEELKADGFTLRQIEFLGFPQKLLYVFEPNFQRIYIIAGIIVLFIVLSAAISVVILFVRKIFHNIFRCIDGFGNSVKSEFSTRLLIEGNDEISKIEISFNSLIDKIQDLMKISAKQSSIAKESQLKALQQQINPHFMYNTLEVFAYKMELYQHYQEADAMVSFADMLRYNTVSNDKYATVADELEQVKNYIHIQQIKYENVEFEATIPQSLYDREIIRFILQPLVENSFTHGYCGKPLKILLSCIDLDNQILFEICDNGHGITEAELKAINTSLDNGETDDNIGIGLKNINMRLKLFYSENYKLHLDSKEGEWTMTTFKIPKDRLIAD